MFGHHHVNYSRVRCVHNVAKGPKVNILVDGKLTLSDVPYKAVSAYLKVPSGEHSLAITTTDGVKTLASTKVNLEPGRDYTVIAHGNVNNLSSIALLALKDNNACPKVGKSHIRFIHAAATVPNVDIWVNDGIKIFENVSYGSTGKPSYWGIMATKVNLSVKPAGSFSTVLGPLPLNLESGKTYTIIASGLLNDKEAPISAIVSEDNACYTHHTHF